MKRFVNVVAGYAAALKRVVYRGGRPGAFMRMMNRLDARLYASAILSPRQAAVLTVAGRHTGRSRSLPVAVAEHDGERYLVSMLGPEANWVRNVRASGGQAVLRHRRREVVVVLEEIPAEQRAPVLRQYLAIAPGARPHFPVDHQAPLSAFEQIARQYPVFRIREK